MKKINLIPLVFGLALNYIFYMIAFQNYGMKILSIIIPIALLSFEISNRNYNIKTKEKSSKIIFVSMICFSVFFNLIGQFSGMISRQQKYLNSYSEIETIEKLKNDYEENIKSLEDEIREISQNLYFKNYNTGKEELITPIKERSLIKAGLLSPGEIDKYRLKKEEKEKELKLAKLKRENYLLTNAEKKEIINKSIFSMFGRGQKIIEVLFLFLLSIILALIPSMSIKYYQSFRDQTKKQIPEIFVSMVCYILWWNVDKGEQYLNSVDSVIKYYKNNLDIDFKYTAELKQALILLECHDIIKQVGGVYCPAENITKEIFVKNMKEFFR